jgi:hypothetical protein
MGKIDESRSPLVFSPSFSTAGNVVEEFTNIMHPEIIIIKIDLWRRFPPQRFV